MNIYRLVALIVTVGCLALPAQVDRGTLTGIVSDTSGAVVPGTRVVIESVGTGAVYRSASNEAGVFTAPNLPPGVYRARFEAASFKQLVREGIALRAAEVVRLDVTLELGDVTESISVTAELPRLQTETPEVGTHLDGMQLLDLPLSFAAGRQPESFAFKLTPGVAGDPWQSYIGGTSAFSKEVLLDGASVSTTFAGNFGNQSVSAEALAEFKVQTSGSSAEFGRSQGGIFNFIMKSGTNELHGSAYGALRNEALNANTFANNFRGDPKPLDRQHNFAFSLGGPVFLPKIYNGKNRSFFYTAYERYRQRNLALGAPSVNAPLPEFYEGDFSRLLGPSIGRRDALDRDVLRGAIYDPATFRRLPNQRWVGDMFPGNRIPVSRFSSVSQRLNDIAKRYYLPTVRDADGQIPLQRNASGPLVNAPVFDQHQFSVKGDQVINDPHRLSGSYNYVYRPRLLLQRPTLWNPSEPHGGPLARSRWQRVKSQSARLAWDWVATPRVLNHMNLSYNRSGRPGITANSHIDGAAELGIRGLSITGYPVVNWGGGPFVPLTNPGQSANTFSADVSWGFRDTVSFSIGRHFVKAGIDLRRNHLNVRDSKGGAFTFHAVSTAIPGEAFSGNQTGYSFASYLLGIVHSGSLIDPLSLGGRRHYYGAFIQDDFKVSNRLTLQLGLRWEHQPPFMEAANRISSWSPTKLDPATGLPGAYEFAGKCGVCTGKRYFGTRDYKNFGPRIGFAWRPAERWTLRGAYGVFYEGDLFNGYSGTPFDRQTSLAWSGTWDLNADPVSPWAGIFNWDAGFPVNRFQPASFDVSWGNRNQPGMVDSQYGLTPYVQHWNLNVQRQIARNLTVDLGYVANKGTRLQGGELKRLNQLDPSVLTRYGAALNNAVRTPAEAAANGVAYPFAGFRGTVASAMREFPQVQGNLTVNNYGAPLGFSTYHSFQATVNRQFGSGLKIYGNYTWSKTLANVETSEVGADTGPLDYYNLRLEKTPVGYDIPHMMKAYVDYQLPVGSGKLLLGNSSGVVNALAGGWSFSAILNYFSGTPLGFGASWPLAGGWNGGANRANVAAGELKNPTFSKSNFELSSLASAANTYLVKSQFADPGPLRLGTSAPRYGFVRSFGVINEDLALQKNMRVREKYRVQLRFEMLNALNRSQLGGITTTVTSPLFGQVTDISGSRLVQAGMRLDF